MQELTKSIFGPQIHAAPANAEVQRISVPVLLRNLL